MVSDEPTPPQYSTLHPRSFYYATRARKSSGVVTMDGQRVDIPVVEITTVGPGERTTFSLWLNDARELSKQLLAILKLENS